MFVQLWIYGTILITTERKLWTSSLSWIKSTFLDKFRAKTYKQLNELWNWYWISLIGEILTRTLREYLNFYWKVSSSFCFKQTKWQNEQDAFNVNVGKFASELASVLIHLKSSQVKLFSDSLLSVVVSLLERWMSIAMNIIDKRLRIGNHKLDNLRNFSF